MGSRKGGAVGDAAFRSALLCGAAIAAGCPTQTPPPAPPTFSLTEFQPSNTGRGGRTVAVSISARDPNIAIAAGESGGLFKTTDRGTSWSHLDSFPPFRMSDVVFAPPGFGNQMVVMATATADANTNAQANQGGVWASSDEGATWTHVVPPAACGTNALNGFGIEYLAPSTIYVATGCGVLTNTVVGSANWTQQSNWTVLYSSPAISVTAQSVAGAITIDVCRQGAGHDRSTNGGTTWRGPKFQVACPSPHSIATSPLEPNVLFGIQGGTVVESHDGGLTWPIDLKASSFSERPKFVVTHRAADQIPNHFDLYFSGRWVTCATPPPGSNGQRCPTNTNNSWTFVPNVPNTNLNHDINGVAISPVVDNCPVFEAFDFGVLRRGPTSPTNLCGPVSWWTIAGQNGNGLASLQIYSLTGQVTFPSSGGGTTTSGHTTLAFGTMDNMMWGIYDANVSGWSAWGVEGGLTQMLPDSSLAVNGVDRAITYADFGGGGAGMKILAPFSSGAWGTAQSFTGASPPGNRIAPFLVASGTYVKWSEAMATLGTLFMTTDNGGSWTAVGTLPSGFTPQNGTQVAQTMTGGGPVLYEVVKDSTGKLGVARLTHFIPAPATPRAFEITTLGGVNSRGFASGLQDVWAHCFGQGNWYCVSVFAADPADYTRLYAVDQTQQAVYFSSDAGYTWQPDLKLTNLVTAGGVSFTDSIGGSQIHRFAFDQSNTAHIVVGTDQAGIFASANGGQSWSALPGTSKATVITSFFFDNRTSTIYLATYGRGLWKLTIDWTTVH
jgi:photosystem II stability/assembly factor-like uncharacterized protein